MNDSQKNYYIQPHDLVTTFTLTARPLSCLQLPEHPGSMFRGILGHSLISHFCQCNNYNSHSLDCTYVYLFEGLRRNNQDGVPAVFLTVLENSKCIDPCDTFSLSIHFLALSSNIQDKILSALEEGLKQGVGSQSIPCHIEKHTKCVFELPSGLSKLLIKLDTPWLIKRKGSALSANQFRIHDFLIGLAMRQRIISEQFGIPLYPPTNDEILVYANSLSVTANLTDSTWFRHSNRQQKKHPLKGVIGSLEIKSKDRFPEWLNVLLVNGIPLHGGGKTSFGLGAFTLTF